MSVFRYFELHVFSPVIVSAEKLISQQAKSLVAVRRYLHRNPEISANEFHTTQFLAQELEQCSIPHRLGPENRGIIVDLGNPDAKQRLAIRADIDAIAVHDGKDVDYRSTVENVMHACGHDAHATILLGTVRALAEIVENRPTELAVRAIFQPEEEIATGASSLIDFGVLDGVTSIIAGHVDPTRDVGKIGLRSGVITAHCSEIFVDLIGRGGHAARPYETIDPIEISARFINECYQAVRRHDPGNPVVLSYTAINGGQYSNVIPDTIKILGTMRSLDENARQRACSAIRQIAASISADTGAEIHLRFGLIVPSVVADETMTDKVRSVGTQVFGANNVEAIPSPSMGGEDFAFYSQQLPAAFVRLGCRGEGVGNLPLHNSGFDIDERVLEVGVKLFTHLAIEFLYDETKNSG